MFTITIQAETADETRTKVLALAASMGAKFTADAPAIEPPAAISGAIQGAPAEATAPAEKRGRGRPPKTAASAAAAEEKTVTSEAPAASDTGADLLGMSAEPEKTAPALTIDDCRNALTTVIQKKGGPAAKELAAKFGFAKLPELAADKYAAFIDACKKAVA